MTDIEFENLKYPIGKNNYPNTIFKTHIEDWISVLQHFPNRLEKIITPLNDKQLNTRYRPNGWTVRQLIHHISDSHHHSYIRFKWAITENNPLIKAYNEKAWAKQHDYNQPIDNSLLHIKVIHTKLVLFLKGLSFEDFDRTYVHPENNNTITLKETLSNYAWHSNHHYAHIERLIISKGWR